MQSIEGASFLYIAYTPVVKCFMLLILYHVFKVSGENKNINMIEKDTAIKYLTDNGLTEDDSLGIYDYVGGRIVDLQRCLAIY